jgi:tetratricopeptide (TPR) repeat protein
MGLAVLVAWGLASTVAQGAEAGGSGCVLVEKEGKVEVARKGTTAFKPVDSGAALHYGDQLQTGSRSRATLRWSDLSMTRVDELTGMEIQPPAKPGGKAQLDLKSGASYFFSREKPTEIQFRTPVASGAIRGTEFNLSVGADGRTEVALLDGEVELSNAQGATTLKSGEKGTVEPGKAPTKTALIDAINVIQWVLYYPAVVDPDEFGLGDAEKQTYQASLKAYREGDLLGALGSWPESATPGSDAERLLHGALLLAAGRVEQTEADLKSLTTPSPLANALREVIVAVKHQTLASPTQPTTGSEWMARSYYLQSRADLPGALKAAREATGKSSRFGAAWVRVAELEFGFGRTADSLAALDKGLELSPRNAEGLTLKGFLLAARNQTKEALDYFDRAIAVDGALANAWLGRGLVKIRRGEDTYIIDVTEKSTHPGREDLQTAATLEPQRAILRSYLGKSFSATRDNGRASKELALARQLDPSDPTAWLYSALLAQQENEINQAIGDLEKSQELNDNRKVYRSRLLLDQDRAVRGANLANIYRDDGMIDVSVREAGKAVNADYANYSAHLFLANSFNELRDPRSVVLRYETPYLSEYLLANLLAPVGAGTLSQSVSQQEYSKLFERDRLGFASATEYLSRGSWAQNAVQFGTFGNTSYALEGEYLSDPGQRVNQDVKQLAYSLQIKQQIGPADSFYVQALTGDTRSGDLNQYADPALANPSIRVHDQQKPILIAGYHHEWAPGNHTLLLLSRLDSNLRVEDPRSGSFLYTTNSGPIDLFRAMPFQQSYDGSLEIYSAEAQQIWQHDRHTLVAGARAQFGNFDTANQHRLTGMDDYDFVAFNLTDPAPQQSSTPFDRETAYAYYFWQVLDPLQLVGGVAYDRIGFPRNHRFAPIADESHVAEDVLPKAGFQWFPATNTAVRFAFTRSLSGASFDQSFRLEPVQLAGFNQAYRSIIPETLTGANAGARFETFDLAWEHRFPSRTYFGVSGELLLSDFGRWRGAYLWDPFGNVLPSHVVERLDYQEKCLRVTLDQLLGRDWVLGARYQWCHARLEESFPDVPPQVWNGSFDPNFNQIFVSSRSSLRGDLHQVGLQALFNHPSGFFAGTEGVWYGQTAETDSAALPSSSAYFWQWHARAGWRSPQRRLEASVAVLNILDEAQGLHPINLHTEPPQRRTLAASLQLNF